jgi:ABC-type antimicrobial peptide transport system permease subunit
VSLVRLRCRAELRAKWRNAVVLILLIGMGGGIGATALAGARRTDEAIPQFVTYSLPDDGGFLFGSATTPPVTPGIPAGSLALPAPAREIVDLPQVVAHFRAPYLYLTTDRTGRKAGDISAIGVEDADMFRKVDRPLVLAGHLPNPAHPFEVTVNDLAARQNHLHVGSRVLLYAYSAAQVKSSALTGAVERLPAPQGPSFRVRVAAIVRFPQDVNAVAALADKSGASYEGDQNLYLTPAFLPHLATGLGIAVQQIPEVNLVGVRLRHGSADWEAFAAAARSIGGSQVFLSPDNVYGVHQTASSAQRGIHLVVVALVVFAALALLVTLALVGQALGRQTVLESDDYAKLRLIGATRPQIVGIVLLRSGLIGVSGALLAFVGAVLASPLMPLGLARQAEVHPGVAVDDAILIPTVAVIGLLITGLAAIPAWRVSRRSMVRHDERLSVRTPRVSTFLMRSPLPPEAALGVRYALESGPGPNAVPVASAMIGAVLAVAVLAGALTFGTSLGRLVDSPREQGWNWNVLVGNPNDMNNREAQVGKLLAHNPLVGSYSAIAILASQGQGSVAIDGTEVPTLLAIDRLKGSVYPPLLQGHPPRADDQIVLGTQTLEKLHRKVGQSVRIQTPTGQLTLRIVGRMIAPSIGDLFTNSLGDGGWVYGPAVRRQEQQQTASGGSTSNATPPTVFNLFAVRYASGVSPTAAFASLRRQFGPTVLRQLPSEDVINLQSVDGLPVVLAGLVLVLGVATVGNSLITSVRRRRRDFAILKTIGFTPHQVARVVAWQATMFSLVALVVGIPLGIAGGQWAWNLVASSVGSTSPASVPTVALALTIPGALVVCNVMAAVPGWVASRVGPSRVMRSQ